MRPFPLSPTSSISSPSWQMLTTTGESATQAIYTNEWAPFRSNLGATSALADIDFFCGLWLPGRLSVEVLAEPVLLSLRPVHRRHELLQRRPDHPAPSHEPWLAGRYQLHLLALHRLRLRRRTLARSSRTASTYGKQQHHQYLESRSQSRRLGLRHHPSVDRRLGLSASIRQRREVPERYATALSNAFIGGWQLSGIIRATSGLPFSVIDPGWTTDWQQSGDGSRHRQVSKRAVTSTRTAIHSSSTTQMRSTRASAQADPIRLSYPGENGQRNNFRGDGIFDLDSGLYQSLGSRRLWQAEVRMGGLQRHQHSALR